MVGFIFQTLSQPSQLPPAGMILDLRETKSLGDAKQIARLVNNLSQKYDLEFVIWVGENFLNEIELMHKKWFTYYLPKEWFTYRLPWTTDILVNPNYGLDRALEFAVEFFKRPEFSGKEKILIFGPSDFPKKDELKRLEKIQGGRLLAGIKVIMVDVPIGVKEEVLGNSSII